MNKSSRSGWQDQTLAQISSGGLFTDGDWVESKDQDPDGSIRLTQLADVGVAAFRDRSSRWMREDQAAALGCTFLNPGDVLIARMPDPIGRACLVPSDIGPAVTAVDVAILRIVRTDIEPRYVMWAINTPQFYSNVVNLQSGTTRKRISRRNLATLSVPIPPLHEQRRIVDILEDNLSRLDAADQQLMISMKRSATWLNQYIDQMIWKSEFPEIPVGELLGEPMRNGHSARAARDGEPGIRTLTLTAVTKSKFVDEYTKITIADPRRVKQLWLSPGDILVQRSNTSELVGTTAIYDGPKKWAIFPDLLIRLRADRVVVSSKYLAAALGSDKAHRLLRSKAKGLAGSMPKIDQKAIALTAVPVPPRSQQDAIVGRIEEARRASASICDAVEQGMRRSSALRKSLLAAAFSGRLTGRSGNLDPIDESTAVGVS